MPIGSQRDDDAYHTPVTEVVGLGSHILHIKRSKNHLSLRIKILLCILP